jgi:hypothetical protein
MRHFGDRYILEWGASVHLQAAGVLEFPANGSPSGDIQQGYRAVGGLDCRDRGPGQITGVEQSGYLGLGIAGPGPGRRLRQSGTGPRLPPSGTPPHCGGTGKGGALFRRGVLGAALVPVGP